MPAGVRVEGLDDFRRDLQRAESTVKKDFRKKERDIARVVAGEARRFAIGTGGSTGHFASSVSGTAGSKGAAIGVRSQANAAFWGAKKNTGWNRRAKRGSRPQHPKWVGNAWEVGGSGGPYGINPAIRHELPKIDEMYLEAIDESSKRAFPNGA